VMGLLLLLWFDLSAKIISYYYVVHNNRMSSASASVAASAVVEWLIEGQTDAVLLRKSNGSELVLRVGDFIKYKGRDSGVCVDYFTFRVGGPPLGMCYAPWRAALGRWASPKWTLKGNMRHALTPSLALTGGRAWGELIEWDSVVRAGPCPVPGPYLPLPLETRSEP
jgi:hypothetical protein